MLSLGNQGTGLKFGGGRKRPLDLQLRLNSMMDMFTILLVFLLKSFSAEGQLATVTQDLRLPESTSTRMPKVSPIVSVTKEWIILDDKPLVKLVDLKAGDGLVIPELDKALAFARSVAEQIGQQDVSLGFHGIVDIMADRETPFMIVKRVMFTCGKNGYNNMQLAVYGPTS